MSNAALAPKIALLFTLPVNAHANRITAAITIKINPRFFNKPFMCMYFKCLLLLFSYSCDKEKHNYLTDEIFYAKKVLTT